MRAYMTNRFGDLEDLRLADVERPKPEPDEVLVRVRAAALNPADYKVLTATGGGRFLHAAEFPLVLGFDFSGSVEQVGEHVKDLEPGADVFGFLPYSKQTRQGTFAEYVTVSPETIAKKSSAIAHVDAACAATAGSTALQGLRDKCKLSSGAKVLINGASGGVGAYATSIAKLLGAEVWGTCSQAKTDFVRERGADHVIDYKEKRIRDLSVQFDAVFDAASTSSFAECRPRLTRAGTYVTLLPSLRLATGIVSALISKKSCKIVVVKPRRDDLTTLAQWMEQAELRPAIGATYPLPQLPEALVAHRSGKIAGKIAITID
jgi:NADPH:quinone reductase-like Zn-dependent oxidoreductase